MTHYDVPFTSQFADLGDHQWRARGCGIAALKMVMDFWGNAPSLDELLREGLVAGAYREGIGWSHRGLAMVAQAHGYQASNVDVAPASPTPETADQAWQMLIGELERGPVLVSVWRSLDPQPHGGHIVVLTGWDGTLVSFNDPIERSASEGQKVLVREVFMRLFKQRWIIIHP